MTLSSLTPRKALNKAYLKVKPDRASIEVFKAQLIQLLDSTNDHETEEHHKNLVSDFLKKTYYDPLHFINTKGRNDLVIHNGDKSQSTVGVIIEAKKPTNKTEMLKPVAKDDSEKSIISKINVKAFQELVLYYLRERITHKNLEVKHLVATNINEWFIFDANTFDRLFAQNKTLVHQFTEFEAGRLAENKTDFFYKQIAEPFIANISSPIEFTYFNLQDYQAPLRNDDKQDDHKLIALYKLLSPEHLLNKAFVNDSNSLDKRFYSELLHIIGLTEIKVGGKKLIQRNPAASRNSGSILEDAIIQLDSLDKINRLDKPSQYGSTSEEKLFNVSLELAITWINRILFLKLLEAQLITYHKGNKSYTFLNIDKIRNYDDLNSLFFQVLAKKQNERNEDVRQIFAKVPYLNSSLFEPTEMEQVTLLISNLKDDKTIPIISGTVLKDENGKKKTGKINTLEYLFEFLNAYDFSSEGSEEIQEENKTLINASVLGLIFEKINGYKDGSFFTPGFITMYMCRETIRRAVVQKFNEVKGWDCADINALYNKINDATEANAIVNSIKIVDPAVGSGHFLVSALNEIIAVKNDLDILQDRDGKRLKNYHVEVVNDELIITDEDGKLFEYNPTNKETQRIQETLFHEKHTIIENCLFGVDINPNSVKICRLRLWIELLKNAYYKNATELETLPNIDINIKCGNSLVSRFAIDADLRQALKKSKWTMDSYRVAVDTYRNAQNKEQKREMERLMADIKSDFRSEISSNDPKAKKLYKLSGELLAMSTQQQLFDMGAKEKAAWNKKLAQLTKETKDLEVEIEDIKANKIYENAFEWRFEFPEVLNNDGDFIGFDVVIGNPPYVGITEISQDYKNIYEMTYRTASGRFDLYSLFIEKAQQLKQNLGSFAFIVPGKFLNNKQFVTAREMVCKDRSVTIGKIEGKVFDDAQVDSVIIENHLEKSQVYRAYKISIDEVTKLTEVKLSKIVKDQEAIFRVEINEDIQDIIEKLIQYSVRIKDLGEVKDGIIAGRIKDLLFSSECVDSDSHKLYFGRQISRYCISETDVYVNYKPAKMMDVEMLRVGNTGPGLRMRDIKIFQRPKILYRKVGKEIIAALDETGVFYEQTLHSCYINDNRIDLKFALALLNSNLLKFYYHTINSQGGDIFPQVRISSVENMPIKVANEETQAKVVTIVNDILETKKQNPQADTTALEAEIDQLVYVLYGLSEEEIGIVEGR